MFVAPLPEAVLLLSCMHHPAVPGMMTTPEPTTTLGVGCGVKKGAAALICKLYKNHCHDAKETATPARLGGEGAFVCTRNVETLIKAPFLSGVLRLDVWVVCAPPSWGHVVDGGHMWPPTFFYYYYYCCDHVLVPFWRKAQKILRCNLRHFFFLSNAKVQRNPAPRLRLLCGEGQGFSVDYQPSSIPGSESPSCCNIMRHDGFLAMCEVSTGLCLSEGEATRFLPPSLYSVLSSSLSTFFSLSLIFSSPL